jgi:hypothetical protein
LADGGPVGQGVPAADPPDRPESSVTVTALVMSRGGVLAWSARSGAVGSPTVYELWAMTAEYEHRVALGAAAFTDLKLYPISHRLTWRTGHSGPTHTASF